MPSDFADDAACDPFADAHVVRIYRKSSFLQRSVVSWVKPALDHGGGAVLVCTTGNASRILSGMREEGLDAASLADEGRIVVVPAEEFMRGFMRNGRPDEATFARLAGNVFAKVREACGGRDVRAWGEMVNLLWKRGNAAGARALEDAWNGVIATERIRLLCSYDVSDVDSAEYGRLWDDVCATHGRLICEAAHGALLETDAARAPTVRLDDAPASQRAAAALSPQPLTTPPALADRDG